jgi:FkbM family methyltransferase
MNAYVPNNTGYSLSDNGDLINELGGKKLLVSSYVDMFVYKEVFYDLCYDFYTPYNSLTVVDIGMNVGAATIFFSNKKNVNRIYAYEPFPDTYNKALENIKLNVSNIDEKICTHSFGVSDVNKKLMVAYDKNCTGDMSVTWNNNSESVEMENVMVEVVDAAELFTAIINKHPEDKFVFKVDCEGSEYDILQRLHETSLINKIHVLILEWHNREGKHVSQLEAILKENGFIFHIIGNRDSSCGMLFAINN